jgi:hypothetical protein
MQHGTYLLPVGQLSHQDALMADQQRDSLHRHLVVGMAPSRYHLGKLAVTAVASWSLA